MSKELLNESEIRKMMKIANLTPLAGGVISRLNETYGMEEDSVEEGKHEDKDPVDEMKHGDKDKDPVEEGIYEDEDAVTEEMAEDDLGGDMDMDAAGGDAGDAPVDVDPDMAKDIVMDILDMVMDAAKAKLGDAAPEAEIDADGGDDMGMDDAPMDDMPMDMSPEAEKEEAGITPSPDMGAPDDEEKPPMEEDYALEEDDTLGEEFVNEVTRRVARRLIKASRKNS